MRNTSYRYWMIYVIAIVAAMGGLLFGFDTGVISGAIPFFQKDFGIDDSMVEVVTSSGLLGAILGALCCGKLTDRIGRRKVILTSAVIFAIGALWSGWAPGIYHLIAAFSPNKMGNRIFYFSLPSPALIHKSIIIDIFRTQPIISLTQHRRKM